MLVFHHWTGKHCYFHLHKQKLNESEISLRTFIETTFAGASEKDIVWGEILNGF